MAIICIHVYIYTVFGEATHTAVVLERKGESERQREKERESRTRQWGSEMNVVEEKERRDMESEKQNTGGKWANISERSSICFVVSWILFPVRCAMVYVRRHTRRTLHTHTHTHKDIRADQNNNNNFCSRVSFSTWMTKCIEYIIRMRAAAVAAISVAKWKYPKENEKIFYWMRLSRLKWFFFTLNQPNNN